MRRVSVQKLTPGMRLARAINNEAGMTIMGEGTELTASLIDRLEGMGVSSVRVEGRGAPEITMDKALAELEDRFRRSGDSQRMGVLKSVLRAGIEERYE